MGSTSRAFFGASALVLWTSLAYGAQPIGRSDTFRVTTNVVDGCAITVEAGGVPTLRTSCASGVARVAALDGTGRVDVVGSRPMRVHYARPAPQPTNGKVIIVEIAF